MNEVNNKILLQETFLTLIKNLVVDKFVEDTNDRTDLDSVTKTQVISQYMENFDAGNYLNEPDAVTLSQQYNMTGEDMREICSYVNQRIRQLYENLYAQKDNTVIQKGVGYRTMNHKEYEVVKAKKDKNLSDIAAKLNNQLTAAGETTQGQEQATQTNVDLAKVTQAVQAAIAVHQQVIKPNEQAFLTKYGEEKTKEYITYVQNLMKFNEWLTQNANFQQPQQTQQQANIMP